jgi:hypothetical protein
LQFGVSHHGQAEVEFQLKKLEVVIDEVVSQIVDKERLALEAANSGNSATQEIYVKSLEALSKREEALSKREEALREEKAKLLDAALVRKKEPSAGTFTLIAGCRPV